MFPETIQSGAPGRLVRIAGVPGLTHAFIPNPLPPDWPWPSGLYPLLMDAHKCLARLDGVGKHVADQALILRPLQNREAQLSSKLEGTITEPQMQLLFQINPGVPSSGRDPANSFLEVYNYGRALRLRKELRSDLPLSLRLIARLHEVLMDGVRGSDKTPGRFRRNQNQIGNPAHYVPPPAQYLAAALDSFEKYLHSPHKYDPLVEAFIVHYQFEAIHPFADGNGRVGRLLLSVLIEEWCNLSNQWLYMSSYFDKYREEYIDRLLKVSSNNDWRSWIEFCLNGVIEQATDTERRYEKLLDLSQDYKHRLERLGGSYRLRSIAEELFELPVTRTTIIRNRYGVSYPTAARDVDKLAKAEILSEIHGTSPKAFYAPEIFSITYE